MFSKEFEFLNIIANNLSDNSYLGDDCAYLDEYKLCFSSDSLVEGVHFLTTLMTPEEIAKKAMLVNISDILASGAKPKYVLISLGGILDEYFIEEFYKGIDEIAKLYEIKVIGGDLVKSDKVVVNITIVADYKDRKVSSRKNALNNYIVAVAGEFGTSAKGLEDLKNGVNNYFSKIHKEPKLYPQISSSIATKTKKPYAMMDSSDSLADCLLQISKKSNVRIDINYNKIPRQIENPEYVLYGGEDYSLVVCLDEEDFNKIDGLIEIGKCSIGSGVFVDGEQIEYRGFKHFE